MKEKSEEEKRQDEANSRRLREMARSIRSIHPLGMRVVIQIRPDTNMTESGLYLPEGAKQAQQASLLGKVLSVATAVSEDEAEEDTNISGIPEGALVLIPRDAGVQVPWDEELRIVETADVLALVEEVDLN